MQIPFIDLVCDVGHIAPSHHIAIHQLVLPLQLPQLAVQILLLYYACLALNAKHASLLHLSSSAL